MANSLLEGFIIGFSLASIIGPVSVLCIRRTMLYGYKVGVASTLGATTIEAAYGAVAAFGISFIADFLIVHQTVLRLIGGLILLYLGVKTIMAKMPQKKDLDSKSKNNLWKNYFSILLLMIPNPMTILSYLAVFAGFGVVGLRPELVLLGIIFGSLSSYAILVMLSAILHKKFNDKMMAFVNKISGAIICGFAAIALSGVLG